MLQAYPGSDPIRDVLTGTISLRRFRLMVEHLPPGNPLALARFGQRWSDTEALLWQVESRLRELLSLTYNVHRGVDQQPHETDYLPRPRTAGEEAQEAAQRAYDAQVRQQLEQL